MKKLNIKATFFINALLILIVSVVYLIGFLPEKIAPISSGNQVQAIYSGDKTRANVSLMFNVYENSKIVCGILDELKTQGVKATFFVGGCWADDNGEILSRIVSEGHEIGNHGYFHKDHKTLNAQQNNEEIRLTGEMVEALCGVKPTLFAPPSGSFSSTTIEIANELGYKVIMWSKDTIDWRDKSEELVFKRATSNLENGDFVLMHPKQHTLNALPKIINYYKQVGFSVVTVGQSLSE